MKKNILLTTLSLSLFFLGSCMTSKTDSKHLAMEANKTKLDKKLKHDAWFAVCAADGGMLEVRLGELAKANSASSNVKQFGERMVNDHSKGNQELKQIASGKNISLPDKLSDRSQKNYDDLAKKTGTDFDKAYMKCMVKDHKKDVHMFKMESKKGKDTEISKFASDKVPLLKDHLELAKTTCKEVKKKK
jgi:putative membrane protein